ncbi:hypothetical protein L9F63_024852, partial [Diploptera punctata]
KNDHGSTSLGLKILSSISIQLVIRYILNSCFNSDAETTVKLVSRAYTEELNNLIRNKNVINHIKAQNCADILEIKIGWSVSRIDLGGEKLLRPKLQWGYSHLLKKKEKVGDI